MFLGMGHPQPVCTGPCGRDNHPHSQELLAIIKSIPTLLLFDPIPPCPVTTVPEEELPSCFPVAPSLTGKVLRGLHTSFSSPAPTFSAFPLRGGALVPSATLWLPLALNSFSGDNRGHQPCGVSNNPWPRELPKPRSSAVPKALERGGESEQGQCREPESQRWKADDPGCLCSVCGGFKDAPGISSRALGDVFGVGSPEEHS